MAAISSRGRSRRRTINEINMVPFIDVMLVLLIIFMVSAPLITTGVIDVPSVGKSRQQPEHVLHVSIGADEKLQFRRDNEPDEAIDLAALPARVRLMQAGDVSIPVVISADRKVRYEAVVQVMDKLQQSGIQRVGLGVRNGAAAP